MALPTNITTSTTGHAELHNQVNAAVNALEPLGINSGWRDLSPLLLNGWTAGTFIRARRYGGQVQVLVRGLNGANATSARIMNMPRGFEPITDFQTGLLKDSTGAWSKNIAISTAGGFQMDTKTVLAGASAQIFTYPCSASVPAEWPGNPA